jgi:hypothetical protein
LGKDVKKDGKGKDEKKDGVRKEREGTIFRQLGTIKSPKGH